MPGWIMIIAGLVLGGAFYLAGMRDAFATKNHYRGLSYRHPDAYKRDWSIPQINRSGRRWQYGALLVGLVCILMGLGVIPAEDIEPMFDFW